MDPITLRRPKNATLALLLVATKAAEWKKRALEAEAKYNDLMNRQDAMAKQIELLRDQLRECG